jgi:hypothetical protein
MKAYRVRFLNELTNDSGHVFHCCQRVIDIHAAKSMDRAIEAAKRRFARLERMSNWTLRAQSFEVEEMKS